MLMTIDEKRSCVDPPVPKCYLGQFDAQNDVLVLENLQDSGYQKYNGGKYFTDISHCKIVLNRMAQFHALSILIQRDAGQSLFDLFPFAVDAVGFSETFERSSGLVKRELIKYLNIPSLNRNEAEKKVEKHLKELFLRLVVLRSQPRDPRIRVLVHGCLDVNHVMFQYDVAGRPVCAKFLDFSTLTLSSPAIDISYFLHSSVLPELANRHHSELLHHYHKAHIETIKSFGMQGFQIGLEKLLSEYISIKVRLKPILN